MSDAERFYVVLRDDDLRLRRHDFHEQAQDEAKRLAEKEDGHAFFVLKATHCARRQKPPIEVVVTTDELPF